MHKELYSLLAPRIQKNCVKLFDDEYFTASAREALVQVEKALKQKGKTGNKLYGVKLIKHLFEGKEEVKLSVPLGNDLQKEAKNYFQSVFSYYRNYVAHDGALINQKIAIRILIVITELLELIDSSSLSLSDHGGVKGLIQIGSFGSEAKLHRLLNLLDGYPLGDGVYDGLFETLTNQGYGDGALTHLSNLGLIYMQTEYLDTPPNQIYFEDGICEFINLTVLGKEVLKTTKPE